MYDGVFAKTGSSSNFDLSHSYQILKDVYDNILESFPSEYQDFANESREKILLWR